MTQRESDTLKKFVISNNSFCNALTKNETPILDSTLKIELIIYYLTLNKEYLIKSNIPNKELYLSLIEDSNFILEDNCIIINDIIITLEELINIVNIIENTKKNNNKIIYLNNISNPKPTNTHFTSKGKIIEFNRINKPAFYTTHVEKALIYERTTKINQDTIPYITHTKEDFISLMNDMIIKAINDSLENYPLKYLKVLSSYLNLYPFTVYAYNKREIPFQEISLPQNEIGLRKTTINNPLIDEIEKKIKLLLQKENELYIERERYDHDLKVSLKIITRIEQELIEIEKEKSNYFFSLYILRMSPEIYNENILMYITKSYQSGTIEINRFLENPIIKLFYIKNNQTEFHCSMRLDTLFNLINSSYLLEKTSEQKILKLEV